MYVFERKTRNHEQYNLEAEQEKRTRRNKHLVDQIGSHWNWASLGVIKYKYIVYVCKYEKQKEDNDQESSTHHRQQLPTPTHSISLTWSTYSLLFSSSSISVFFKIRMHTTHISVCLQCEWMSVWVCISLSLSLSFLPHPCTSRSHPLTRHPSRHNHFLDLNMYSIHFYTSVLRGDMRKWASIQERSHGVQQCFQQQLKLTTDL